MKKLLLESLGLTLVIGAVGCANALENAVPAAENPPPSPVVKQAEQFRPDSEAGVDTKPPANAATLWADLIKSRSFSSRPDPFALQPKERGYEARQGMERVFDQTGRFSIDFVPQVETVVVPEVEPQPYRRLAGVIVGDSVLALIDMGDGQLQLIRPGQTIQGWKVLTIDSEKAILQRGGNKLPHQITVRLETPPPGGMAPGSGGGGNQPGQGGGGNPNQPVIRPGGGKGRGPVGTGGGAGQ